VSVPERLGRYVLGETIGEGGMGIVLRARVDSVEGFSRAVAVKMVHHSLARDPGIREAFVDEARTAQRLQHGNIVQVIDVGLADDQPYMVIELVDGVSLAELLRSRTGSALPVADTLYVIESVASALAYAHGLTDKAGRPDGVVHRDVTPRNILLSRDGLVKLADFGIAKALTAPSYTLPGTIKGSLGYLAPEQARGDAVDARADQFSTGVVLYEMLAGKNPLASRDVAEYHAAVRDGLPRLTGPAPIDDDLAAIVARATAHDPGARFASMDDLRAELESWRVERKIRTLGESLRETLRRYVGVDATIPSPRPLGAAVAAQLPARQPSIATRPHAARKRRGWRLPLLVSAVAVTAIVVAYVVGSIDARERSTPAIAVDAALAMTETPPAIDAIVPAVIVEVDAATPAIVVADAAPKIVRPRGVGRLRVNVMPYANVYVDGRLVGEGPVDVEVAAGSHALVLHNPDTGRRQARTIRIKPGAELVIKSW
jgi:serine/threonine-protein kinase